MQSNLTTMISKALFFLLFALLLFVAIHELKAQESGSNERLEMDVEEFMGVFDGVIRDDLIEDIGENLPDDAKILTFGYGDFSGDGFQDVAVAYRTSRTPVGSYKVMFMLNQAELSFKNVGEVNVEWYDAPFDIGMMLEDGVCLIIHRKGSIWHFSRYIYAEDELRMIHDETD